MPTEPVSPAARRAHSRARMFALLRFSVLFWACVYFALVAISGHTYFRSIAFGLAATFALWLILGSLFSDNEPMPVPDAWLLAAILAWAAWCRDLRPVVDPSRVFARGSRHRDRLGPRDGGDLPRRRAHRPGVPGDRHRCHCRHGAARDPRAARGAHHPGVRSRSRARALARRRRRVLDADRARDAAAAAADGAEAGRLRAALAAAGGRVRRLPAAAGRGADHREPHDLGGARHRLPARAALAAWRWRRRLQRAPLRWGAMLLSPAAGRRRAVRRRRDPARARRPEDGTTVAQAIADDPAHRALAAHVRAHPRAAVDSASASASPSCARSCRASSAIPCSRTRTTCSSASGCRPARSASSLLLALLLIALAWRYARFLRAHGRHARRDRARGTRDAGDVRREEPDRRLHDPPDEQGILGAERVADRLRALAPPCRARGPRGIGDARRARRAGATIAPAIPSPPSAPAAREQESAQNER